MGVIDKIKLLFKSAKPVGEFINQVKGARMKYKTIPFWTSILLSVSAIIASLTGFIPPTVGVIATSVLAAAYNILRGLDKANQVGVKPVFQTTEFWIGVGTILSNCIIEIQKGGVNAGWMTSVLTILGAAMAAAQNLAAHQPEEVAPPPPQN